MVYPAPSRRRAVMCVGLAVGLALAVGLPLALTIDRYKTELDISGGCACGTSSAYDVAKLPGVCLNRTSGCAAPVDSAYGAHGLPMMCMDWTHGCTELEICCTRAASSHVSFLYPVAPNNATGVLIWPDVLEPRWEVDATLTEGTDLITVWCWFIDANLPFYIIKLGCEIAFWGRFDQGGRFASNDTLVLQVGGVTTTLTAGDIPGILEVQLSLGQWWEVPLKASSPGRKQGSPDQVNMAEYPDFSLPFALWFGAWWDKEPNTTNTFSTTEQQEPPVVVQWDFNYVPNFVVTGTRCINTTYRDGSRLYAIKGFVQLSQTAKNGVYTLNACMWTLAMLACVMSFLWCMLSKPKDHMNADVLCFSGALLFAIPTMRGLLPAAPSAGTRFDVLNVYGQLLLVTISIGIQVCKMVFAVVHSEWSRSRAHLNATNTTFDEDNTSVFSSWVHFFTCSECQCRKRTKISSHTTSTHTLSTTTTTKPPAATDAAAADSADTAGAAATASGAAAAAAAAAPEAAAPEAAAATSDAAAASDAAAVAAAAAAAAATAAANEEKGNYCN